MAHARDELPASLRSRVDLLQADITGGVSDALASDLRAQPWRDLARLGPSAPLEAAAACLEPYPVADPPQLPTLAPQGYSLVFSDLVLTHSTALPLLDVVDMLAMYAPDAVDLRETHTRYRQAAQAFRRRVALAHIGRWRACSRRRERPSSPPTAPAICCRPRAAHARDPRETLTVLPNDVLAIPDDLAARFQLVGPPRTWEWLVTAPDAANFGRSMRRWGWYCGHKEAVRPLVTCPP